MAELPRRCRRVHDGLSGRAAAPTCGLAAAAAAVQAAVGWARLPSEATNYLKNHTVSFLLPLFFMFFLQSVQVYLLDIIGNVI